MTTDIHVSWTIDCEASQKAIDDVETGRKALRGFVEILADAGLKSTAYVIPGDAAAYPDVLTRLAANGVEIGLHCHPQEQGWDEFCGAYTADQQRDIYAQGLEALSEATGLTISTFRAGSASANDASFPVLAELGFESCSNSMPGRRMTNLRSDWVNAPLHVHYTHPANRLLEGGLDLVEAPITTDPDSMLWSGGHPQDLRVELFDAKNQRYMIDKILAREKARPAAVRAVVCLTHNIFAYDDPNDFRHQTMKQMIRDFAELADKHEVNLVPATIGEIAAAYRQAVPQTA